jgi:ribosomal protein L37AE/L43A
MYGFTIQEHRCPRCGIRRTARIAQSSTHHCFNCRFSWVASRAPLPSTGDAYPFTRAELERLTAYRDAVRAGLYDDWRVIR